MSDSKIMVRKARDDLEALLTVQGMEKAGAEAISVAYDGEHQQLGAMIPCSKFVVFARVPQTEFRSTMWIRALIR